MLTPALSSPPLLTKLGPVCFRALGRQAQRLGTTAAGSIAHAERTTGPLSSEYRRVVMSGWDDESRMGMGGGVMWTADNLTDEAIEALRDSIRAEWHRIGDWTWDLRLELALCESALNDALDYGGRCARGKVAKILNARSSRAVSP